MKTKSGSGIAASLIVACVFGVAMLLALTTGAGVYRQVQDRVNGSADERLGITYITAKIHSYDMADYVKAGSFGGEDAVFLQERLSDGMVCETIIYVHNGWLMELFCVKDSGLGPDDGQQIIEAQDLTVTQDGRMIGIDYTDADGRRETSYVYLRSGG